MTSLLILYYSYNHCYNEAIQDTYAIFDIITQNHPGIYNKEDSTFKQKFENEFQKIIHSLQSIHNYEDGLTILQQWICSFDDPHLRLVNVTQQSINQSNKNDTINWCWWTTDTFYMRISTFAFHKKEITELEKLLEIVPDIQKAKNIVFDVQGNGGGSSLWAKKIISTLFGKQYVQQKTYFYEKDVKIDWRASTDNWLYIKKAIPTIDEQFGKESLEHAMITHVSNGIEESIKLNKPFFTEAVSQWHSSPEEVEKTVKSLCDAHIFVVIDAQCASATLSFIDHIKPTANQCTLIGQPTAYDTEYMECHSENLPSGRARLIFPIKVYRNRYRKSRQKYVPDIYCDLKKNSLELREYFLTFLL